MIPSAERDFIVAQIELRQALVAVDQCQRKLAKAKELAVQNYLRTRYPELKINISCSTYANSKNGPIIGNTLYLIDDNGPVGGKLFAEVSRYLAILEEDSLP